MIKKPICHLDDIPLDGVHVYESNGIRYLIYREGDSVFACEAVCPHMGGPLEEGEISNGCVTCPWHGWRFDLKSGHCENVQGQQLRLQHLVVKDRYVFLDHDENEGV